MKSFVSIAQHVCPVCGKTHQDESSLLMDKTLRDSLEPSTTVGYAMCAEHKQQHEQGYVHLVVANNNTPRNVLQVNEADRTGEIISIRGEILQHLIDVPIDTPMLFIEPEAAEKIKELYAECIEEIGEEEAEEEA